MAAESRTAPTSVVTALLVLEADGAAALATDGPTFGDGALGLSTDGAFSWQPTTAMARATNSAPLRARPSWPARSGHGIIDSIGPRVDRPPKAGRDMCRTKSGCSMSMRTSLC